MPRPTLPDLSSRQLRAVLALAENRSFIAAAAFLKVSQPALTRTIKQVEAALGVELFTRSTRRVSITPAGKEFIALAERLLNDLTLGIDNLQRHNSDRRGQVVVSSVLSLADGHFARLLASYRQRFPGIDVHLREGMQDHVLDDVRGGGADFGIGYVNDLPESLLSEGLGVETLHVVFPTKSPLARAKKIAPAQLNDAQLVSYSSDSRTRRSIDRVAAAHRVAPRHVVTVNRLATLLNLVREGVAIAVVPSSERPHAIDRSLTSRPLAGAPIARLGILRLRDRELTPSAAEFHSLAKEWIRAVAPRRLRAAKRSTSRS